MSHHGKLETPVTFSHHSPAIAENHRKWEADYLYDPRTNEFRHRAEDDAIERRVRGWFDGTPGPGLTGL